ncbi:MAG: mannose-1-phosphate guanylyltransferase [Planctomycetes bacterium]|nr:mannose-1-phosphate guanylyltransferase [Planctomycetota bacterium]
MNSADIVAVIMAGGVGTRFWPLSTPAMPKQFITAFGDQSLYQQAVERACTFTDVDRIVVVTNEGFRDFVQEQTPELPRDNILLEPMRRDTAAAIALSASVAERRWPGSLMVVMPSDHLIRNTEGFYKTVKIAVSWASEGAMVTIGIPPTYPATVYGYLHLGDRRHPDSPVFRLRKFIEKPKLEVAESFVASGEYLWNSGIFIWPTAMFLAALREHLPQHYQLIYSAAESFGKSDFRDRIRSAFDQVKSISIDFGVMEKLKEVWAVPASFDWSDLGGWKSAKELIAEIENSNRVRGNVILDRSHGNLVLSSRENHTVLCIGVQGLIVVTTPEGTLICREDLAEEIKAHVQKILEKG